MTLLGIDVGTGGTRAVVVDDDGHVVASATEVFATLGGEFKAALDGIV